jgi:hypothetical protein
MDMIFDLFFVFVFCFLFVGAFLLMPCPLLTMQDKSPPQLNAPAGGVTQKNNHVSIQSHQRHMNIKFGHGGQVSWNHPCGEGDDLCCLSGSAVEGACRGLNSHVC